MDLYHAWFNLMPGVSDVQFSDRVHEYLGHLKEAGLIAGYRLTRRKLGLGAPGLGEFHIIIEVEDLAQLDRAFDAVAARSDPTETLHRAVNSQVSNSVFALYRDFPDPVRKFGDEKF
jgi:hypothetical protein